MITTGLFDWMRRSKPEGEQRSADDKWFFNMFGPNKPSNMTQLTDANVTQIATVAACENVISQDLAKLSINVYQRDGRSKSLIPSHPVHRLLNLRPNPDMSAFDFKAVMFRSVLLRGNAYAQIVRDYVGKPLRLNFLPPQYVKPKRMPDDRIVYEVTIPNKEPVTLEAKDVLHIKGRSDDGLLGLSPIDQHALSLGVALATAEYARNFFENGAAVDVAVKIPSQVDGPESLNNFKSQFEDRHLGSRNSRRVVYTWGDGDIRAISITPDQAQFLSQRKYQQSEICGIFRVPPHKIGDLERSTNNNIETQEQAYINDALQPLATAFEQEALFKLFDEEERDSYLVKYDFDELLRGDMKTRYEAYHFALGDGWLNPNEVRDREDMNPFDGGDDYRAPLNTAPVGGNPPSTGQRSKDEPSAEHRGKSNEHRGAAHEQLAQYYIDKRKGIEKRFARLIETELGRLVKREAQDVTTAAKKAFTKRGASDFSEALDSLYAEHSNVMVDRLTPTMHALADSIAAEAKEETKYEVDLAAEVKRFVDAYVANYADVYTRLSRIQLEDCVKKALEDGKDPIEAIQELVDKWQEERVNESAQRETKDLAEGMAHNVWKLAGVTAIVWHTSGTETCAACKSLDGQTVGIEKNFFTAGQEAEVEGADGQTIKMTMQHDVKHAPLHSGCDCSTGPVL